MADVKGHIKSASINTIKGFADKLTKLIFNLGSNVIQQEFADDLFVECLSAFKCLEDCTKLYYYKLFWGSGRGVGIFACNILC